MTHRSHAFDHHKRMFKMHVLLGQMLLVKNRCSVLKEIAFEGFCIPETFQIVEIINKPNQTSKAPLHSDSLTFSIR
jgi:hypothetical protein